MFAEKDLPGVLGVSRTEIGRVRKGLVEGVHWVRERNGRAEKYWKVYWTEAGMEVLKGAVGVEAEVAAEISEKVEEVKKEWVGVVTRKHRNPRIVTCRVGVEEVSVLVRDSGAFVLGMSVPLRKDGVRWVAARHPRVGGRI